MISVKGNKFILGPAMGSDYARGRTEFDLTLHDGESLILTMDHLRFIISTISAENSCRSMNDLWRALGGKNWKWGGWDER